MIIEVDINVPDYVKYQRNVSLLLFVERNPIKFQDLHKSEGETTIFTRNFKDEEGTNRISKDFLPESFREGQQKFSSSDKFIYRFVSDVKENITNLSMDKMPGFKISWTYEPSVESQSYFRTNWLYNQEFFK